MYNIPVKRELVYELKERIYHNQYKMFAPVSTPSFSEEWYGTYFPKFTSSDGEISVRDFYGKRLLDIYHNVKGEWAQVSRVANIKSRPASKALSMKLPQNVHTCPANSRRNLGRQGSFIVHAVEYGSYYHRLIPESSDKWTKIKLGPQISAVAEVYGEQVQICVGMGLARGISTWHIISGNELLSTHLELHHALEEVVVPSALEQALSKYFCIMPALLDIPDLRLPKRDSLHLLDKCIFVPKESATSRSCRGLQLFRNLQLVTNKNHFCDEYLGRCALLEAC
jgi:hypothetical protein